MRKLPVANVPKCGSWNDPQLSPAWSFSPSSFVGLPQLAWVWRQQLYFPKDHLLRVGYRVSWGGLSA